MANVKFQSTLPMWGATPATRNCEPIMRFQSTLPMWGATTYAIAIYDNTIISIHAPHVGSDQFLPIAACP